MSAAETAHPETLSGLPSLPRRLAGGALELIEALGLVLVLPAVIIALGLPIVLSVRLAMWIFGMP